MSECDCGGLGVLGIDPETTERLWCDCPEGRKAHLEALVHDIDRNGRWLQRYAVVYPGLANLVRGRIERLGAEYDELKVLHVAHLAAELGLAQEKQP